MTDSRIRDPAEVPSRNDEVELVLVRLGTFYHILLKLTTGVLKLI